MNVFTLLQLFALFSALSYGIASTYAHLSKHVEPFANAHGSMWAATLLFIPFLPFFPAAAIPTPAIKR